MAGSADVLARALAGRHVVTTIRPGLVVDLGGGVLGLNVDGAQHAHALWPVATHFRPGDTVRVLTSGDRLEVLPPVLAAPRPDTGTIAGSPAGGLVPVTTTGGDVQARYTGTPPAVGTLVRLDWAGTTPWVWPDPAAASTPATIEQATPDAPPGPAETGTLRVPAIDSASRAVHRGAWATTTGTDVLQGTWGSYTYRGYWWHGAAPKALAGRTLTAVRMWVPARRPGMGAWSDPATLHVYAHTQHTRGANEPALAAGPWDITIEPQHGGALMVLPTAAGAALVASGGGLAIAGDPYAGVRGIGVDLRSGTLELDWRR